MKITVVDSQKALAISRPSVKKVVLATLDFLQIKTDEVIVHFIDKAAICALHESFFNDPTPTDCISFPIDYPYEESGKHHLLGEVFVCPEVAVEYARTKNKDPYAETTLYLIHGLLHLAGYDDLQAAERRKMRAMERRCLEKKEVLLECVQKNLSKF
ncbi:MAG TPA: rRNA maturation RNase YbeY [Rhabdochlamydiaceae bacterium]|nr:rRNA maturation RNase YbeY [Rhabdochlamydiaceae bacterium]